ncbi:MAG: tetratricopeptide repeat protein [Anaerolineales bacterium]|nr:tetratricopeptide repeat protein [Anaerolineales bacterium]
MTKESVIEQARKLRRDDELEESQALLLSLLEEHEDDPLVLYEVGGSYDVLGEEKEAIPYYQKAVAAGLDGSDLQECLVCLGSCQRNIGDFEEAVETLQQAVNEFPENNSSKTFLALAYYSDGQEDEAVRLLLDLLLQTTKDDDILAYADALDYYKDNLDEVWDE